MLVNMISLLLAALITNVFSSPVVRRAASPLYHTALNSSSIDIPVSSPSPELYLPETSVLAAQTSTAVAAPSAESYDDSLTAVIPLVPSVVASTAPGVTLTDVGGNPIATLSGTIVEETTYVAVSSTQSVEESNSTSVLDIPPSEATAEDSSTLPLYSTTKDSEEGSVRPSSTSTLDLALATNSPSTADYVIISTSLSSTTIGESTITSSGQPSLTSSLNIASNIPSYASTSNLTTDTASSTIVGAVPSEGAVLSQSAYSIVTLNPSVEGASSATLPLISQTSEVSTVASQSSQASETSDASASFTTAPYNLQESQLVNGVIDPTPSVTLTSSTQTTSTPATTDQLIVESPYSLSITSSTPDQSFFPPSPTSAQFSQDFFQEVSTPVVSSNLATPLTTTSVLPITSDSALAVSTLTLYTTVAEDQSPVATPTDEEPSPLTTAQAFQTQTEQLTTLQTTAISTSSATSPTFLIAPDNEPSPSSSTGALATYEAVPVVTSSTPTATIFQTSRIQISTVTETVSFPGQNTVIAPTTTSTIAEQSPTEKPNLPPPGMSVVPLNPVTVTERLTETVYITALPSAC